MTDRINARFPPPAGANPDSGILWYAGYLLNDPEILAPLLSKRPGTFVILSMPETSVILPCGVNDGAEVMAAALLFHAGDEMTSWEILSGAWQDTRKGKDGADGR